MRDRMIALGMRRPIRLMDEDYDVPMLTEDDFEIVLLPEHSTVITRECTLLRDVEAWQELAKMCIAKAKLCLCIGHVLSAQYSVLPQCQGLQNTRSSVMLFPKKLDKTDTVRRCDLELRKWIRELPVACQYSNKRGVEIVPNFVSRALLHMTYFATVSALHRPQVLSLGTNTTPNTTHQLQNTSLDKVREASREITRISQDLQARNVERYLPTTTVSILLSAIIIYLLDIKSCNDKAQEAAIGGLRQCMLLLEELRDNYTSADFATQFLLALMRKLDIDFIIRSTEKFRWESPQNSLKVDRANERSRSLEDAYPEAAQWNTPLGKDDYSEPNRLRSQTTDINIPVNRLDNLCNTIPALTPESEISDLHAQLLKVGLDFTSRAHGASANIDLDDFLKFDSDNEHEKCLAPPKAGFHGESDDFLGDLNCVDSRPGAWWIS